jgi:hypothetical protein
MLKCIIEFDIDNDSLELETNTSIPTRERLEDTLTRSFPCIENIKIKYVKEEV